MGNRKPFNFGDAPLVQDTERTVESGYEAIEQKEQGGGSVQQPEQGGAYIVRPTTEPPMAPVKDEKPAEPTKGVQTYIPISQYRRLNDIKLTRGENIADLAAQAIYLWLDVQEGKLEVKSLEL